MHVMGKMLVVVLVIDVHAHWLCARQGLHAVAMSVGALAFVELSFGRVTMRACACAWRARVTALSTRALVYRSTNVSQKCQ